MRATRLAAVAALPLAAAALLTACSSATSTQTSLQSPAARVAGPNGAPDQQSGASVGGGAADSAVGGGGAKAAVSGPPLGTPQGRVERSVNATFVVPHGGFLGAFQRLIERAASLGGYVVSSSTSPDQSGRIAAGSLTVRVPAARLNDMVTGTPGDWHVSAVNYASVDHTAETVDLNARLQAAKAHRDALQGLLTGTHNLQDITALEQQIAQVQLEVDQDQGAVDAVNGRVDMATATISLSERGAVAPAVPPVRPRLLGALADGAGNALAVVAALTEALVSAAPVLVLAGLVGLLLWRLRAGARERSRTALP
jgi:hypothetical protein